MAQSRVRIGGSGFTLMSWQGQELAWLQIIQDTAPVPVAQAQAIQSIDDEVPFEIVTAQAVGAGTLKLTFYELWNGPVWANLPGFGGSTKLLDVLRQQAAAGNIAVRKFIRVPNGGMRTKVYIDCVITDADDGDNVNIGTMSVPKAITVMYRDTSG
jgi:hypothetical protein